MHGSFTPAAIDTVLDGIRHIGFAIRDGRFVNNDGNANAMGADFSLWVNSLLVRDPETGTLANDRVTPMFQGSTGAGLDRLVGEITCDEGLNAQLSRDEISDVAWAADTMNRLIVNAIRATGVAIPWPTVSLARILASAGTDSPVQMAT